MKLDHVVHTTFALECFTNFTDSREIYGRDGCRMLCLRELLFLATVAPFNFAHRMSVLAGYGWSLLSCFCTSH